MSVSVLIVDGHADVYEQHLRREFPDLRILAATDLSQLPSDLSGIHVLVAFGVSIDEETTNLIRFQHAYQASARVISVVDELTQTVMNMLSQ